MPTYDRFDNLSTLPYDRSTPLFEDESDIALPETDQLESQLRRAQCVTATLPLGAPAAFDLFCDQSTAPEWVSVLKSTSVLAVTSSGRPELVAFLARLTGASIGYTIAYRYNEPQLTVSWTTAPGAATVVIGRAKFSPLGAKASLLDYRLVLELPGDALPPWADPGYNTNPASAIIGDFRDFLNRRRAA